MLNLIQSNRMQILVDALCANQQLLSDPFEPVTVVVQSQGIGQWLKVELAEKNGIAANIDCILPAELIWRLYRSVLSGDLPEESAFSRQRMTWRIMQLLPGATSDAFLQVQSYLKHEGDKQLRLYQFSQVLAGLFDQYLIYRPDWITQWQTGADDPHSPWQSQLWRQLLDLPGMDAGQHRASLHTAFLKQLATKTAPKLPAHISLLGISSLPGMHMDTLKALAAHIDISIYFLNPCEHYWGDIVSEKESSKHSIRHILNREGPLVEEDYLEVGNPLLSSMGKQGREFFELLLDTDNMQSHDLFMPAAQDSALALVQNDILQLEFGGHFYEAAFSTPTIRARREQDQSIQIHSCHSRMREVEVLLNQIYGMLDGRFSEVPIKPADIIVMAPDIGLYTPYIEAVFKHLMPYSITDRPVSQESAVLVAFERLVRLPDSRLTASEVMDLLQIPAISRKFELTEPDLGQILYWVQETGIRFELDGESKESVWGLPEIEYNTWRFGLDRLLLGLAMESSGRIYQSTAPFPVTASDRELIGKLCHILDLLADYRVHLAEPVTANEWLARLNKLIDDFIEPDQTEEFALNQLRDALEALNDETESCNFFETISPKLLRHWLQEQLEQTSQSRGFVSGGVTFATLVPMRSIPYEAVCLIGMNDQQFPRQSTPVSFDLMAQDFRKGDRSRRNDDRYLFLEALLSAGSIFYASYEGRSQKDNKDRPASTLVAELKDYLQRIYQEDFVTQHPLQPFNPIYYVNTADRLLSYQRNWYEAQISTEPQIPFVDARLLENDEQPLAELDQLINFYRNPAKYFLKYRLGVDLSDDATELKDTESFKLDGLDRYQLADSALSILLEGGDIQDWQAFNLVAGHVMPGDIGRIQLGNELTRAENIANEVLLASEGNQARIRSVNIALGHRFLTGEIQLFGDKHIAPQTGQLHKRQLLAGWIRHLALCSDGYTDVTILIAASKSKGGGAEAQELIPVERKLAISLLAELAELYEQGLLEPLAFLPETSWVFHNQFSTNNDWEIATEKAMAEYANDFGSSEYDDRHYQRLFSFPEIINKKFATVAGQIYTPLIKHIAQKVKK